MASLSTWEERLEVLEDPALDEVSQHPHVRRDEGDALFLRRLVRVLAGVRTYDVRREPKTLTARIECASVFVILILRGGLKNPTI